MASNLLSSTSAVPFSSLKSKQQKKCHRFLDALVANVELTVGVKLCLSLEAAIANLPMDGKGGEIRALLSRSSSDILVLLTEKVDAKNAVNFTVKAQKTTKKSKPIPPFTRNLFGRQSSNLKISPYSTPAFESLDIALISLQTLYPTTLYGSEAYLNLLSTVFNLVTPTVEVVVLRKIISLIFSRIGEDILKGGVEELGFALGLCGGDRSLCLSILGLISESEDREGFCFGYVKGSLLRPILRVGVDVIEDCKIIMSKGVGKSYYDLEGFKEWVESIEIGKVTIDNANNVEEEEEIDTPTFVIDTGAKKTRKRSVSNLSNVSEVSEVSESTVGSRRKRSISNLSAGGEEESKGSKGSKSSKKATPKKATTKKVTVRKSTRKMSVESDTSSLRRSSRKR